MILIGLSGKKRSGKNTVAKLMSVLSSKEVREYAFGDALKDEVSKACGVTRTYLEEHKDNFRLILQGWGTDFRRMLHKDGTNYWINKLGVKLLNAPHGTLAVVTDVRFKNEANFIRYSGGVVIRVNRPSDEPTIDEHASEVELDDYQFDYVIDNNSTLNDLSEAVKKTLHSMKIPTKQ